MKYLLSAILIFILNQAYSQDFILNERYIQLSGLVMASDSDQPVPNASIRIRNTYRGVSANMQGFFSLVVKEGDWIDVSSMGFKKQSFQIPAGLKEPSYIKLIALQSDTIVFKTVSIYPWPSKAKFKEAFLKVEVNKTYQEILEDNFNRMTMQLMLGTLLPDAGEMQSRSLREFSNQSSTKGITPTIGVGANIPFGSTQGYTPKKPDQPPVKW